MNITKYLKSNKGITLLTLTITIVIMIILSFTVSINVHTYVERKNKSNLETDIIKLKEEIDHYYSENKELPVISKYTTTQLLEKNINDNENYYVIDLEKMRDLNLSFGKDYKKIKNSQENINTLLDIYIINEQSHTIYYPKGIQYNGKIYYTTMKLDTIEINHDLDIKLEISEVKNKTVVLTANGIDIGAVGIKSYKFYIDNKLERQIDTDNKIQSFSVPTTFGEHEVYVIVENNKGDIRKSQSIKFSDYTIKTIDDINTFTTLANNGETFKGKTITLIENIELDGNLENQWQTIENFEGILDGKYHSIDNVYISGNSNQTISMFKNLSEGAIIKNIKLKNVYIHNEYSIEKEDTYTACLVCYNRGKIENIGIESGVINTTKTTINTQTNIYPGTKTGSIAAMNLETGEIKQCYNKAKITSKAQIEGYAISCTGGIIGVNLGTIENSYNIGKIETTGIQTFAGGIIGYSNKGEINNSYNIAEIIIQGENSIAGGILGRNETLAEPVTINNSYYSVGDYAYYDWSENGYIGIEGSKISNEQLKTYSSILGNSYKEDENNINNGYPILKWQE